jgi:23S rRNA (pseudouridine1915-N3)-methyltransferase
LALEFRLLWAGRRSEPEWEPLEQQYLRRIAAFHPIASRAVKATTAADDPLRRREEAKALEASAPSEAFRVALDRSGRELDSEALAREVGRWRLEWSRPVVFFIGSDLGLERELVRGCRLVWSLGELTLGHSLARLVVLEQLYRALDICTGGSYHRSG